MIEEKIYLDPDSNTHNYYINTSIKGELKSLQRAIALLRQDLPKIIHEELVRSKK